MNSRIKMSLVCFVCSWCMALACDEVITDSTGQIRVENKYTYCSWIFVNSEPSGHVKVTFNHKEIEEMSYFAEVWNYNSSAIEQYGVYNNEVDSLSIIVPNSALVIVFMDTVVPTFNVTFRHETTFEDVHRTDDEESDYSRKCSRIVHDKLSRIQNEEYPDSPPDSTSCLWFLPVGNSETLKMSLTEPKGSSLYHEKESMGFWKFNGNTLVEIDIENSDDWEVEHPLFIYWQTRSNDFTSGFRLVYEITPKDADGWQSQVPKCNQTISSGSGVIASAHYPLQYKEYTDCIWWFKPKPTDTLYLHVIGMDIYNLDGFEDYLDFWTISDKGVMFVGDHETLEDKNVITSVQPLLVKFHTDEDFAASGFKILYEFLSENDQHALNVDNHRRLSLEFPTYENDDCQEITTEKWKKIIIHPGDEAVNFNCLWILKRKANDATLIYIPHRIDYLTNQLQIWDKFDMSMSSIKINENKRLVRATGTVMIHLKYSGEWAWSKPFTILIRPAKVTKCSQLISESSNVIQMRAGYLHEEEQNCLWYLKGQPNMKVRLDFLQNNFGKYTHDFLNIWVLDNNTVSLVSDHKVLGTKQTLESTKPMIVQFHSENQITESEWQIKYAFDPIELGFVSHIGTNVFSLPEELKCRRTIEKRDGTIDLSELRSESEYGDYFVCVWILKRIPDEKTLLYKSLASPTNYGEYFHIWDQLETSPRVKSFSDMSEKKPSIMTGTVMIQMKLYLYKSSSSLSIQYRGAPLVADRIQSLGVRNRRKGASRVGHP